MNRRRFVALGATTGVAGIAGCTGALPDVGGDGHIFADQTVSVRVEDLGTTDHDVHANAREALAFWEAESEQYVDFAVDFELIDDDPDMEIVYVDTPERCAAVENYSASVLGCAPLIRPGQRVSRPATAVVVAANRPYGKVRITTKHEIGHILGLGHDDAPAEIMSNRPEDRIPLFAERIEIWEATTASQQAASTGTGRFNSAVSAWNDEAYADAETAARESNGAYVSALDSVQSARTQTDVFVDHPRVETVALDDLTELLDRLIARMEIAVDFSRLFAEAAAYADEGNTGQANDRRRETNDRLVDYNAVEPVEIRDIAVALGLVRGFEREGTVAEPPAEDEF